MGELDPAGVEEAVADFENDLSDGRLHPVDLLWRAALNHTAELSRIHTPVLGTRPSDVLHVACAMELGLKRFLTFDERQPKLATARGLKVVNL